MKKFLFLSLTFVFFSLRAEESFEDYQRKTIQEMGSFLGWCSEEKAKFMMRLIHQEKPKVCVEIGVYAGQSLFPITKALKYNGTGKVFGIDAWDAKESVRGFRKTDSNYTWWNSVKYEALYKKTIRSIQDHKLDSFCTIIRKPSLDAASMFAENSIDFLHLDANHNEECILQDITAYFPKVKDGGFILLNDPCWYSMRYTLIYLLERTELLSEFTRTAPYFLFKKNGKKMQNAQTLFRS